MTRTHNISLHGTPFHSARDFRRLYSMKEMEEDLENKRFIEAEKLPLEEWLKLIEPHEEDRDYPIIDYQFPTDEMKNQYLQTIRNRSDEEVKRLLRGFLICGGSLGVDSRLLSYWREDGSRLVQAVEKYEFAKRMLSDRHTWEGNTWVLDLIPSHPQEAISAINAYFLNLGLFYRINLFGGMEINLTGFNLLGKNPELIRYFSGENLISKRAPTWGNLSLSVRF